MPLLETPAQASAITFFHIFCVRLEAFQPQIESLKGFKSL